MLYYIQIFQFHCIIIFSLSLCWTLIDSQLIGTCLHSPHIFLIVRFFLLICMLHTWSLEKTQITVLVQDFWRGDTLGDFYGFLAKDLQLCIFWILWSIFCIWHLSKKGQKFPRKGRKYPGRVSMTVEWTHSCSSEMDIHVYFEMEKYMTEIYGNHTKICPGRKCVQ